MKKPIIGIVSSSEYVDKGIFKKNVFDVNKDYIEMIIKNDAVPIILPYVNDINDLENILKTIDGLLLIGGEDIEEDCYKKGKSKNPRDSFEIEIYNYLKKSHKPILGICRGLQLINVAEGGTLKNIEETSIHHYIEQDGWVNHHMIEINKNSKLYKIIKNKEYPVSSVHHQKIDKLGNNLIISAKSSDGVIEAIEGKDDFIIAFQGHIEKCLDNFNKYYDVIKEFVKEAKNEKR